MRLQQLGPGGPALPTSVMVGIGAAAAVALAVTAGSGSALWTLYQYHHSPGGRRVEEAVMSSNASRAFDVARTAIGAVVAAKTLEDRRNAVSTLDAARQSFSRDMARAADSAIYRRDEILRRKAQGEAIISSACAPWTKVVPLATTKGFDPASLRSGFLYFKTCLTATTRFQQTLDDQTASLVTEMGTTTIANSRSVLN